MASSRGMAPTVLLPTVPGMGSASTPTKGTSSKASSRVVKVPTSSTRVRGAIKAPKIRVKAPKMPKDANLLMVPKPKRIKGGRPFSTKRKPVI